MSMATVMRPTPPGTGVMAAALGAFVLALGCKETAAFVPLFLAGAAWVSPAWFGEGHTRSGQAAAVSRVLPLGGVVEPYLVQRWIIVGSLAPIPLHFSDVPIQVLRALAALASYGEMTVFRRPAQAVIRIVPPVSLADGRVLLVAIFALLLGGLLRLRRREPISTVTLGWYASALPPAANVIPIYPGFEVYVAERALYPALVGWCLFVGVALQRAFPMVRREFARHRVLSLPATLGAGVVTILLVVTAAKAGARRDDVTLWTATPVAHPGSAGARIALAAALVQEGRLEEARAVIQEATRLVPTDPWAAYIQGSIAEQMGESRAAQWLRSDRAIWRRR